MGRGRAATGCRSRSLGGDDRCPDPTPRAVTAYLLPIRHVGAKRAAKLIDCMAAEVIDAIDADPRGAFAAAGLGRSARARGGGSRGSGLRVTRRLHLLLAPHGLGYLACRGSTRATATARTAWSASGRTS